MGRIQADDRKAGTEMNMTGIEEYIESQFAKHTETTETLELKNEIAENCKERYQECLNSGMSEEEAQEAVIHTIGDLNALIEEVANDTHALAVKEENDTDTGELSSVRISVQSGDVVIEPSMDEEIHVQADDHFSVLHLGNTLMIEEEKNNTFGFSLKENRVTVEIPSWLKYLSVHTKSGDVDLKNIQTRQISISSVSGDVDGKIICDNTEIKTVSGDVDLKWNGNTCDINITTVSGDVDLDMLESKCGKVNTISGDVSLRMRGLFEDMNITSVSGDIEINSKDIDGIESEFHTKSGDIENEADTVHGHNHVYAKTVSGDIEVY